METKAPIQIHVAYTNNSYETPRFSNEVLYRDPTYDSMEML